MSTTMHQKAPKRCIDCGETLGKCSCQCENCGTVRADWQPECDIDMYGTHHWVGKKEMQESTVTCDGCGEDARGEHRCKDLRCLTCAGPAHMPGKCLHPGCACETETW